MSTPLTGRRPLSTLVQRRAAAFLPNTSLRVRLTLLYTLLSVVSLLVVGSLTTFFLLDALERQFEGRLNDRADAISLIWNDPVNNLGQRIVPSDSQALIQITNNRGRVQLGTSEQLQGIERSLPTGSVALPELGGARYRAVERKGELVRIWVALPETDLLAARETSGRYLVGGMLCSALFMLIVGLIVGRRTLEGLSRAADQAHALEPFSRTELVLPRRRDELHTLVSSINDLLSRIREQKEFENRFIGQVAHELAAPMTSIQGYLQRAMDKNAHSTSPSRELHTDLEQARKTAWELHFVAQDLMQMARGRHEITLAMHFLSAQTLRERLERLTQGVAFTGSWNVYVLCDPDRLVQALRNLLANARRAAGEDGLVRCDLSATPDQVVFCVRDSGPGLPKGAEDKIFEAFYSKSNSSGLGLSVASQIAALHGGTLEGRTHEQGGAEFKITLPQPGEEEETDEALEDILEETA